MSKAPRMRKQTIYNIDHELPPPENLIIYIEWLNEILEKIPQEYRESARVEIKSEDYHLNYVISFDRLPNQEEIKAEEDMLEKRRQLEICELFRLRAKYPEA